MELILNASQSDKTERSFVNAIRYDVHEADTLEAEERRDAARQRYQRSYWESVPEDGRVSNPTQVYYVLLTRLAHRNPFYLGHWNMLKLRRSAMLNEETS